MVKAKFFKVIVLKGKIAGSTSITEKFSIEDQTVQGITTNWGGLTASGLVEYDTLENAYAAMISSLIKKDLEWYYETFTKESAAQNKIEDEDADIDPKKSLIQWDIKI